MPDNEYSVELGLVLNDSSKSAIKQEIKNFGNESIKLKFDLSDVKSQIGTLKKEIQSLGEVKFKFNGGTGSANFGSTVKEVDETKKAFGDLIKIQQQLNSTRVKISGLDASKDVKQIQELSGQLERLMADYNNIYQASSRAFSTDQLDELARKSQNASNQILTNNAKILDSQKNLQTTLSNKIQSGLDLGKFNTDIQSIENKMQSLDTDVKQLSPTFKTVQTNVESLKTAFNTMKSSDAGIEQKIQAFKDYNTVLPVVKKQLNEVVQAQQTLSKSETLSNKIQTWMNENAKAAERYGTILKELQGQLKNNIDGSTLKNVGLEFSKIQSSAKEAGLVANSFGKELVNIGKYALGIQSSYMAIQKVIQLIKSGVEVVNDLDDALIDLKKTTTMSNSDLTNFYFEANEQAKQLGVTTKEIIQSAADWSRLGYSDKESAQKMAELSAQFNVISPNTDIDTVTKGMVSTMKAYGIETNDVLDGIMSKINIVGNTAATSNAEIIEGLQNSASAMAVMNSSLDENIALFTAGQEIAQDAHRVGNALRSIALRIRGRMIASTYSNICAICVLNILMITISVKGLKKLRPRKDYVFI